METWPDNWQWRDAPVEPGPTVVFDVDGVLSDASHRQHYLEGPIMYWESFFQACGGDPVIEEHAAIGRALDANFRVVLLTARPGRVRPQTDAWLSLHGERIRWDLLIMREDDDWGSSRSYKAGELRQLQRLGYDVMLSFEDDPRNVEMFRQAGVPTVYIHSGYYE